MAGKKAEEGSVFTMSYIFFLMLILNILLHVMFIKEIKHERSRLVT